MASLSQEPEKPQTTNLEKPWRYNSPFVQVSLVGLVCFCCPGMFNALSGMGGGGQLDPTAANNANTALYAAFAISGVLGGAAFNLLGPRLTLFIAALTYPLYASSFLYYNHHKSQIFPIIAGGVLGVGAGLLWAGQGAIMTSYPPQGRKGSYISLFWTIFNLGGVIGGLIPFSLNYHRTSGAASVTDSTYIAFMVFMVVGALLSLTILPPSRVVRNDGTRASKVVYSDVRTEWLEILKLFTNWKMLLMLPAAWASNFFYTYQFNNVNGKLFTLRTKGLNNVFYWGAQMVGSFGIGYLLDFSFTSRKVRGLFGVAIVAAIGTAIWGGGFANQLRYTDGEFPDLIDFKDGGRYAGPFVLYFSYGLLDAMFQSLVYWVIGALADDSEILSRYSGFYKSVQSAGAAVAWQVDTHHTPLLTQLIINWVLTTISYPLLAMLLILAVKDEKSPTEEAPSLEIDLQENIGYSGFYKSIRRAGAAVAWHIDAHHTPLLTQLIINWVLTTVSYPLLALLVILAVKDDKSPTEEAQPGEIDLQGLGATDLGSEVASQPLLSDLTATTSNTPWTGSR